MKTAILSLLCLLPLSAFAADHALPNNDSSHAPNVLGKVASHPARPSAVRPYWTGIPVPDADASAKWYQENLHFTITRKMDLPEHKLRIVFLRLNDFTLELVEFQDSMSFETVRKRIPELKDRDKLQGFQKLGFLVTNVDALAAELKRKGVKLTMEPTDDRPFGQRFFLVEDNAGNLLQFFQELQ